MKRIIKVVVVFVVVLFLLSFVKNGIVKASVEKAVKSMTGLELRMKGLNVALIQSFVQVKDLRLHNPRGFQDRVMIHLPEVFIDFELKSFMGGKSPHLEEIRLDLEEFYVIRNAKGELNLDSLKPAKSGKKAAGPKAGDTSREAVPASGGGAPPVQIDRLHLKVGKVIYKDYSGEGEPTVQEIEINLDERHENITDPNALVAMLVAKALLNTTVANIANLDAKGLISNLDVSGAALQEVGLGKFAGLAAGGLGTKAQSIVSNAKEKLGDIQEDVDTSELSEKAGQAVEEVKGLFKSLTEE